MSEFKVGDKVVCKYEHIILFGNVVLEIKNFREDLKEVGDFCTFTNGNDYWLSALRCATPEEIAAGHRIDKPSNSGELETLDKPENHISPNCKVEDV
ncbi:hypothetical protein [Acinetobacter baumannii]|uniref:hypothetical protein n=1 Tax=Acinetobacter baumannii TaxID=470 RepID=UPI00385838DC